jgi:hypothetical protein
MANIAALAAISTIGGRLVAGPTGLSTSLYFLILGATTIGKQHQIDCVHCFLDKAGCGNMIGPSGFASMQGLQAEIAERPCFLSIIDEFGDFLTMATSERGSGYQQALIQELNKLFTAGFGPYRGIRSKKDEASVVLGPCLVLMGVSTYQQFFDALKSRFTANGFLNRLLIAAASPKTADRNPEHALDAMPFQLFEALQRTRSWASDNGKEPHVVGQSISPRRRLRWGAGTEDIYRQLSAKMDEPPDEELKGRIAEIALRTAQDIAIGRRSEWVSYEDMVWGRDLALNSLATLQDGIKKYGKDERDYPTLCADIAARVQGAGFVSHRDLSREFGRNMRGKLFFDQAIKQLLEEGRLTHASRRPPGGGKDSHGYEWSGNGP